MSHQLINLQTHQLSWNTAHHSSTAAQHCCNSLNLCSNICAHQPTITAPQYTTESSRFVLWTTAAINLSPPHHYCSRCQHVFWENTFTTAVISQVIQRVCLFTAHAKMSRLILRLQGSALNTCLLRLSQHVTSYCHNTLLPLTCQGCHTHQAQDISIISSTLLILI